MILLNLLFLIIFLTRKVYCLLLPNSLEDVSHDTHEDSMEKYKPKVGKGHSIRTESVKSCMAAGYDMTFLGGDIMSNTVNLYNIYIGHNYSDYEAPYIYNQEKSTAGIIQKFATGMSFSSRSNIMTSYTDYSGHRGANSYKFIGNAFITTNLTSLNDFTIVSFIKQAMLKHNWQTDSNGIYSVFFRGDLPYVTNVGVVNQTKSWLTDFCAFHSNKFELIDGKKLVIQPIGDLSFLDNGKGYVTMSQLLCMNFFAGNNISNFHGTWNGANPSLYSGYKFSSVNMRIYFFNSSYGKYVQTLLSTYIHEIEASVTNSDRGWVFYCDGVSYENSQVCRNDFGTVYNNPIDNTQYNVILNDGSKYLVQSNWLYKPSNGTSSCATTSYDRSPTITPSIAPSISTIIPTVYPSSIPTIITTENSTRTFHISANIKKSNEDMFVVKISLIIILLTLLCIGILYSIYNFFQKQNLKSKKAMQAWIEECNNGSERGNLRIMKRTIPRILDENSYVETNNIYTGYTTYQPDFHDIYKANNREDTNELSFSSTALTPRPINNKNQNGDHNNINTDNHIISFLNNPLIHGDINECQL